MSKTLTYIEAVLEDIRDERQRQEAKFPDQHLPDIVVPDAILEMAVGVERADKAAHWHGIPTEARAKDVCEVQFRAGLGSWLDVLVEEVAEVVRPAIDGDLVKLRAELVQVAAVAVRQIEDIDRRAGRSRDVWGVEFRDGSWLGLGDVAVSLRGQVQRFSHKETAEAEAKSWMFAGGMAKKLP